MVHNDRRAIELSLDLPALERRRRRRAAVLEGRGAAVSIVLFLFLFNLVLVVALVRQQRTSRRAESQRMRIGEHVPHEEDAEGVVRSELACRDTRKAREPCHTRETAPRPGFRRRGTRRSVHGTMTAASGFSTGVHVGVLRRESHAPSEGGRER